MTESTKTEETESQKQSLDIGDMHAMCGATATIVVATRPDASSAGVAREGDDPSFDGNPLREVDGKAALNHVIGSASFAQTAVVYVLVEPGLTDAASRIVHSVKRKNNGPDVQLLEMDFEATRLQANRPDGPEDVAGVEGYIMEVARMLAGTVPGGCEAILVLTPDTPEITGDDIYAMCKDLRDGDAPFVKRPCAPGRRPATLIAD